MWALRLVTLATSTTLPQARALASSLRRHHPQWHHEVVLIAPAREAGSGGGIVALESATPDFHVDIEALIACHDERDLIALVLPRFLAAYSKEHDDPVLHLPPTVWVTGDLGPVAELLSAHSVMLTPRTTPDPPDDGLGPSPADLERAGRISDTTIGVDGSPEACGFLNWWAGHVEGMLGSLDGTETGGRPEDRPWLARLLELAPARFATAVLDGPGCNASMWNLHGRTIESATTGVTLDGRWPLRFMDLAGFEPDHPYRLSAIATRVRVSRSEALRELCATYACELEQAGWRASNDHREVGRHLANGLLYDEALCSLHERATTLGEHFEDLFGEPGSQAFTAWLQGPAPRGGAHGITRYVFYRVLRERGDVMRAYPDLDGPDGAEYVAWCWAFGRHELSIPERFMPPAPPRLVAAGLEPYAIEAEASTNGEAEAHNGAADPLKVAEPVAESVVARSGGSQPLAKAGGSSGRPLSDAREPSCPAVRVSGYLGHALGLGSAARGYAQALSAAGVPTSTMTVALDHMELPVTLGEGYGRHDFDDLVHDGRHGFELVAVNPDELPAFVERVGEDYFHGPRIGIWGWETNKIPSRWQSAFELVDEIWVYSRFMAENIGAATSDPVIALPPPVQPPAVPSEPLRLGVPDGHLFLFMFDYLSTIQRKNPVGLIEAFKRAFAPGEGPQLLLKTINGPLRPLAEEALLWAAHGRPDIHVVDCSLSAAERDGLVAGCDCYVSLHRAEGFGLTMAEAMALGKPVIGTGYSGNLDFMNAANSYLVDYEIGRVGPDCEIYPADGEWADPSVEHAAELMRRVVERPEEAAVIGAQAREDIARALSPEAVGAAMRRRLEELADGVEEQADPSCAVSR
jgi:glycosyltransferase involved in cell wall biosynthesis